jgi:hypothetical protein
MSVQLSIAARNARLDAFETAAGTTANLYIRTGAQPADCAAADSGTLLCTIPLPSDYMQNAAAGAKAKSVAAWTATASAAGVAAHFRIKDNAGTTCHMQGTVGQGSGDMSLDNTNIANGQTVTVNSFTLTDANA